MFWLEHYQRERNRHWALHSLHLPCPPSPALICWSKNWNRAAHTHNFCIFFQGSLTRSTLGTRAAKASTSRQWISPEHDLSHWGKHRRVGKKQLLSNSQSCSNFADGWYLLHSENCLLPCYHAAGAATDCSYPAQNTCKEVFKPM